MSELESPLPKARQAAHDAMYKYQHGDYDLTQEVGWSDGQLEDGIIAAAPYIEAYAVRRFGMALKKVVRQEHAREVISTTSEGILDLIIELSEGVADDLDERGKSGNYPYQPPTA